MNGLVERSVACPYCGEQNELLIDPSVETQEYVEDCQVCCQPMVVRVTIIGGDVVEVSVTRENE